MTINQHTTAHLLRRHTTAPRCRCVFSTDRWLEWTLPCIC